MAEFTEKSLVQNIANDSELDIAIATSQKNPIVIFFWATWYEPSCPGGQMDVLFTSLAKKFKTVKFFNIEAEKNISATEKFNVTVVPTFVFFSGGEVVARIEGVHPDRLANLVKDMSLRFTSSIEYTQTKASSTNSTDVRLNKLVNSAPVMLFMKGSPETPRCGFSRKIVEILQNNQIPFASFDILTDNDVREGLKKLFDWPTYPQLYVNGNLIGGLDIIIEMMQSGDLKNQLLPNNDQEQILSNITTPVPLETRLNALINQAPVMIFIKGSPTSPKCGFSNQLIELLNSENITFSSFDILSDEDVRQGLKSYSDWPTYPQVYVKGALIGGLDIILEMRSTGPLQEQFGI